MTITATTDATNLRSAAAAERPPKSRVVPVRTRRGMRGFLARVNMSSGKTLKPEHLLEMSGLDMPPLIDGYVIKILMNPTTRTYLDC